MKKILFICFVVLVLNGCKSNKKTYVPPLCEPLTFNCHLKSKFLIASPGFWHELITAHKLYLMSNNAPQYLASLESLNPSTQFDIATKHKYIAYKKETFKDYKGALEHINLALKTPILNAKDYNELMTLEIDIYFELEEYERVQQKAQTYLAYMQEHHNPKVFAQLAFIAKKHGNTEQYNALFSKLDKIGKTELTLKKLEEIEQQYLEKNTPKKEVDISNFQPVYIVRIDPAYPKKALKNKIEGWVKLKFDVTPKGRTTNIKIIESYPVGVFDAAGISALSKWYFRVMLDENGKVINGQNRTIQLDWKLN